MALQSTCCSSAASAERKLESFAAPDCPAITADFSTTNRPHLPDSSANARSVLLHQARALAACAQRLETNPRGYDRAISILQQVLDRDTYCPLLSDDALDLDLSSRYYNPNAITVETLSPPETPSVNGSACPCRRTSVPRRPGKLILSGVGKSGHIARKVTATLQSTGSMAMFLHPTEALHGDLGVVADGDALILFSHSGRSDELLALVEAVRRRDGRNSAAATAASGCGYDRRRDTSTSPDRPPGHKYSNSTNTHGELPGSPPPSPRSDEPTALHPTAHPTLYPNSTDADYHTPAIIVICGDPSSPLGRAADAFIDAHVDSECNTHVPAPTASTTLAVAMGDCIALELARRRGFGRREFARNHPGGNLGRVLR